ncbi:MAG: rod shape-determining protein RodA [Acidaminococcaceae bacterium]|nr:rod shape-determining protein RodA [Acidaminococcaceae bacterium]
MRHFIRNSDWILIVVILLLTGIGLVLIASATHGEALASGSNRFVWRQGIFLAVDLLMVAGVLALDYHSLKRIAWPLYGFTVLLLLGVMFFGHASLGAQRWIQLGPVTFQPSEFSKAFMIICLAAFLDERSEYLEQWKDYLPACLFMLVPFVLVLRQPDLGTALVFAAIAFSMFWVCGFKMKWIAALTGAFVCAAPVLWQFLHEYQKNRIRVFLDPELDPFGAGYHVIQSKIAIGSGMLWGKGWMQGTQSQLNFLPENHTDFIFAVAGEEFGFIGAVIILFLYMILIWRGLTIALNAEDRLGTLLATGITGMYLFHVLVNVGMTIGIMPVTGVPLPFLSYGVSSLTTNMLMAGVLLNINLRHTRLQF